MSFCYAVLPVHYVFVSVSSFVPFLFHFFSFLRLPIHNSMSTMSATINNAQKCRKSKNPTAKSFANILHVSVWHGCFSAIVPLSFIEVLNKTREKYANTVHIRYTFFSWMIWVCNNRCYWISLNLSTKEINNIESIFTYTNSFQ